MNTFVDPRDRRDAGFTLPELMIAIVITTTIVSVLAMTIVTSMRTAPSASNRADSAIAVQGITTWLPPDVDSAAQGYFDVDPASKSDCAGATDPGINMVRLEWKETFQTISTTYVANYRFVIDGNVGEIIRLSCSGKFSLGAPQTLSMSAKLSTTLPTVKPDDFDGDGRDDMITIEVVTLAGEKVQIKAATKNPNQTLPPETTSPATAPPTAPPTSPPTVPNAAPTANAMTIDVNDSAPITFTLDASDPEGGALTGTVTSIPAGPPAWDVLVSGTSVTLTAYGTPGTAVLQYHVTDPLGADSNVANITVNLLATPTSSTTSTTTTTTTTTTTIPTCTVGSITVSPNPVELQNNGTSKLKKDVTVTISGLSGYCVGLTLQYDTGAPNNQWVQNFGSSAPFVVTLQGHPHGTELWVIGTHVLYVKDGYDRVLTQANLVVIN